MIGTTESGDKSEKKKESTKIANKPSYLLIKKPSTNLPKQPPIGIVIPPPFEKRTKGLWAVVAHKPHS